ncbi:MAG TPA: hypothetical protein VMS31_23515 [Pyrinomonadaceae bacterium]|nr:hypothetical protein [Pyrinomonadaceae bacterium]
MSFRTTPIIMQAIVLAVVTSFTVQLTLFPVTAATFTKELAPQGTEVVIPDGTEFTVVTTDEISSKTANEDDPINLRVQEDVKINGQVVIAKDTLVKGIVANAKKSGMLGRGGSLGIRIETTTTVDGQKLKLRSAKGKEGDNKTGTTVALVVLFGPLGFLKKGKNAIIKPGTPIKVFTDEDKKVFGSGEEKKPPVRV